MLKGGICVSKRKKAAAAAVTVVAAASVVTSAAFDNPADLMRDPTPITSVQLMDDDDNDNPIVQEEEQQAGVTARIRKWILNLPAAARAVVGVPLWCIGWVLMTGVSTFLATAATPLIARLLGWLCLALILLAVFAATVKSAFPKAPLHKILRPGNILLLLGVRLFLFLADMAMPSVWQGYDPTSQMIWRVGATCLLAFTCCMELKHQGKKYAVVEEKAPQLPKRTEVEEAARLLADSVCPR